MVSTAEDILYGHSVRAELQRSDLLSHNINHRLLGLKNGYVESTDRFGFTGGVHWGALRGTLPDEWKRGRLPLKSAAGVTVLNKILLTDWDDISLSACHPVAIHREDTQFKTITGDVHILSTDQLAATEQLSSESHNLKLTTKWALVNNPEVIEKRMKHKVFLYYSEDGYGIFQASTTAPAGLLVLGAVLLY